MGVDQRLEGRANASLDGTGMRIGLICGRFNDAITVRLLEGACRGLTTAGVAEDDVVVEWVPGAFEIPFAAASLIASGRVDAVVGLGCVIRGETSHYDFVAGECARGLQDVGISTGSPVIFGVLTTENLQQALDRSEGEGGHNVGEEGARTAIEMVQLARRHREGRHM
ncbi:MAG: 6,7-dimethyl-8-ribityllumazine synthase [Microthrixaceae bacterium]